MVQIGNGVGTVKTGPTAGYFTVRKSYVKQYYLSFHFRATCRGWGVAVTRVTSIGCAESWLGNKLEKTFSPAQDDTLRRVQVALFPRKRADVIGGPARRSLRSPMPRDTGCPVPASTHAAPLLCPPSGEEKLHVLPLALEVDGDGRSVGTGPVEQEIYRIQPCCKPLYRLSASSVCSQCRSSSHAT